MATEMPPDDVLGRETIRRVSWRVLPFLMLAYLVCYIDRTNAGFPALQMNKAVGIDKQSPAKVAAAFLKANGLA